jgi:nicotinamidase-related amidase
LAKLWDDLLSDQDRAVIEKAGYAEHGAASWNSRELGTRQALVVIDMQRFIVGEDVPILEAVEQERVAMGEIAWKALDPIKSMVRACQEAAIPVIFTRVIPKGRDPDDRALQVIDQLTPRAEELVIDKRSSSAFFDTELDSYLLEREVDTVVLVGNATSGCVRATAVDARSHGYGVLIPEECVFDRIQASHKIGLLDLWMKYATVVPLDEALKHVVKTNSRQEKTLSEQER